MKFKPRKDLAFRRIAGELFIVDAAASRLHELNGTAAVVWESLAAGRDPAAALAAEYAVDPAAAKADAGALIKDMLAAGLLVEAK